MTLCFYLFFTESGARLGSEAEQTNENNEDATVNVQSKATVPDHPPTTSASFSLFSSFLALDDNELWSTVRSVARALRQLSRII